MPRGAGTGLSGGSIPLADCVLLGMGKFNKILETDFDNRCVVAQPCVTNLAITDSVQHKNYYYAPDPSSQLACSIGGNVAENSGGVHSLKYGTTTNNLMGAEIVLMDGTVLKLGGKHLDSEGYDLLGLITGSEGLLGVVTEVTVRILKKPESVRAVLIGFQSIEDSGNCVADIIAKGIVPAGMEIMDKPLIIATDNYAKAGYPRDVEALLIGHEEMVTSVAWHPNPKKFFDRDLILFSSSMDRSIFLWCTTNDNGASNGASDGVDGVWTPFARVGSPSGILGGPVGSSLLGYLRVEIEPEHGRWIMGHAYGGALHFFSAERLIEDESVPGVHADSTNEKKAVVKWKAEPCITGHFDEVTDICWKICIFS